MSHPRERSESPQETGIHKARRQEHVPGQVGGGSAGQIARRDHLPVAESSAMAAARNPTTVVINPVSTAVATRTTCPPSWFAQHLPGHEQDRAFWASALPDQESGLHVPLKLILAEKLRTVARLTRWYECIVEREQADKRVATAARASAARGSNAAVADEVTEAKAAVSRFEDAALTARERLGKMTEDSSEPSSGRLGALSQISAETSRDLVAAQRRLEKAEDCAIEAANLVRADAAAKAAADIAAAAAEVDAAAEARAAGIDEPAAATSAEIGATITRAKLAVDHYLGVGHTTPRASGKVNVHLLTLILPVIALPGKGPSWRWSIPDYVLVEMALRYMSGYMQHAGQFQDVVLRNHPGLADWSFHHRVTSNRHIDDEMVIRRIFEGEVVPRAQAIIQKIHPHVRVEWINGNPNGHADGYFAMYAANVPSSDSSSDDNSSDNSSSGSSDGLSALPCKVVVELKRPHIDQPTPRSYQRLNTERFREVLGHSGLAGQDRAAYYVNGKMAQYIGANKQSRINPSAKKPRRHWVGILSNINQTWLISCLERNKKDSKFKFKSMTNRLNLAIQDAIREGTFKRDGQYLGEVGISDCFDVTRGHPHLAFVCAYVMDMAIRGQSPESFLRTNNRDSSSDHSDDDVSSDDSGDNGNDDSTANSSDSNQGGNSKDESYMPSSPSNNSGGESANWQCTHAIDYAEQEAAPKGSNCTEVASSSGRSANLSEGTALSLGQGIHHFKLPADGSGMSEYCTEFIPLPRGPAQSGSGSRTSEYRQSPMTSQHTLQALEGACPVVANTSSSQSRPKPISPEQAARWTEYQAANF